MPVACIDLMQNEIGPIGCESIGKSLQIGILNNSCPGCNMTLKTIILDHNPLISDEGITSLFHGLDSNITVEVNKEINKRN